MIRRFKDQKQRVEARSAMIGKIIENVDPPYQTLCDNHNDTLLYFPENPQFENKMCLQIHTYIYHILGRDFAWMNDLDT